jgi:hypothetical protein
MKILYLFLVFVGLAWQHLYPCDSYHPSYLHALRKCLSFPISKMGAIVTTARSPFDAGTVRLCGLGTEARP